MQLVKEAAKQAVWLRLVPPKVAPSKWSTWHKYYYGLIPEWDLKLVSGMLPKVLAGESAVTTAKIHSFMSNLRLKDRKTIANATDGGDAAEKTVKASREQVQAIRNGTKQTAQLMTLLMLNDQFHLDCCLLSYGTGPFQMLADYIDKHVRSSAKTLEYHTDLANGVGKFWRTMITASQPYDDLKALNSFGFIVSPPGFLMDMRHPDVLTQNQYAAQLWNIILHQVTAFWAHVCLAWVDFPFTP